MASNENEMEKKTNTEVKNETSTQNNPKDSSSQQPNISIQNIDNQSQVQNNPNSSQPQESQPQVNQPKNSQPQSQPQPQPQQKEVYKYKLFNEKKNNGIKFEEENLRGTRSAPEKYVFVNAHRKFTQNNIDLIAEYCIGISDIITKEKKDTVENYFKQKDKKNEGFIYLNEFKDILKEDLEIAIEDDFQIFL